MSANDALLLVGHGSARYPEAGNIMHLHAETLRAAGHFAQVEVALLNGAPTIDEAMSRIQARTVRVVPFFMEDGYFSRVAVPKAIAAAHAGNLTARPQTLLCTPVGVHDGMADIIVQQAIKGCRTLDVAPEHASVVLVGHGSARAPGRALALQRHAIKVASLGLFAAVEAACLEEAPFVADVLGSLRAHAVVVIGFFANQGGHVRDDVPALVAAEQTARGEAGYAVHFHVPVTEESAMIQIILDQAAIEQQ